MLIMNSIAVVGSEPQGHTAKAKGCASGAPASPLHGAKAACQNMGFKGAVPRIRHSLDCVQQACITRPDRCIASSHLRGAIFTIIMACDIQLLSSGSRVCKRRISLLKVVGFFT